MTRIDEISMLFLSLKLFFQKHLKAIDKSYQIVYNNFELADTNRKQIKR